MSELMAYQSVKYVLTICAVFVFLILAISACGVTYMWVDEKRLTKSKMTFRDTWHVFAFWVLALAQGAVVAGMVYLQ